jgi:aconitase family protein (aconitate hydratase)
MPQTIVEKIAQAHMADGPKRSLRAGDFLSIRPSHVMTHDNSSAVISKFKAIGAQKIQDPRQPIFALDHDIQNHDEANLKKYRLIEAFAAEHGIEFYPAGAGIGHQIMIERGYVVPSLLPPIRTPTRMALSVRLVRRLSARTLPASGPQGNSGGRFRGAFRWSSRAVYPRGSAVRI